MMYEEATMASGAGETPRQSFDSAYANLESTVRNFSRDKLQYEDTISGLMRKINSTDMLVQENNRVIQTLLTENEKLEAMHEEDQTARCAVDAMLAAAAMKQDFLNKAMSDFESVEREVLERYVASGEFIESLKTRQVQLHEWIGELTKSLQEQTSMLHEAERRFTEATVSHEKELEMTNDQHLTKAMEFQEKISELQSEIQNLTAQNKELQDHLQSAKDNLKLAENQTLETKSNYDKLLEEQANLAFAEKTHLQQVVAGLGSDIEKLTLANKEMSSNVDDLKEKLSLSENQAAETKLNYEKVLEELTSQALGEKMDLQKKIEQAQMETERIVSENNELTLNLKNLKESLLASENQAVQTKLNFEKVVEEKNNQAEVERTEFLKKFAECQCEITHLTTHNNQLAETIKVLQEKMDITETQAAEARVGHEKSLKEQARQATNEKNELEQKIAILYAEVEKFASRDNELTQHMKELQEVFDSYKLEAAESEANYTKLLEERNIQAVAEKADFEQTNAQLQMELDTLNFQKTELTQNLEALKETVSGLEKQAIETRLLHEKVLEDEANRVTREKRELEQRIVMLQSEIEQKNEVTQNLQVLNDKMSEAEKRRTRRSSFHVPAALRRPTPPTAAHGILKRSTTEKVQRVVSFNKNVEVRKFTPITISSSDSSDSDMLEDGNENINKKAAAETIPSKKQKIAQIETTDYMDTGSPMSPRKFFKNRSSPLTYNNCKSPRAPTMSSSQPN